ncbi:MAG: 3'(2'),5'-bisphosphate nucleotidase CysQ [Parvularcula sp.]|nr:3'(2'),5'-bisphosphate nucleotidase CysQ [Parvularcula sp.]
MPETSAALPSYEAERLHLIGAAIEAGHAVLPLFRDKSLDVWKKSDASPVSEADIRANQVLREALVTESWRDYGWLSEESRDTAERIDKARTFIVDPIDGTRAFVRGDDRFAICLAVCDDGRAIASVIYAPARDELYSASLGGGAFLNGEPIASSGATILDDCRMVGQARMFAHPRWPRRWPEMEVTYVNSTSYRMAMVAAGACDATIALTPKADWDAAPGSLIAEEAGARASDHLGRPFRFCQKEPVQPGLVCAAAPLYPHVLQRLAHLPANLRTIQT